MFLKGKKITACLTAYFLNARYLLHGCSKMVIPKLQI
jgi:hypothetical protein